MENGTNIINDEVMEVVEVATADEHSGGTGIAIALLALAAAGLAATGYVAAKFGKKLWEKHQAKKEYSTVKCYPIESKADVEDVTEENE
jgi:hypothetical protein